MSHSPQAPSLFATDPMAVGAGASGTRILADLEGRVPARRASTDTGGARSRSGLWFLLLVPIAAVLLWWHAQDRPVAPSAPPALAPAPARVNPAPFASLTAPTERQPDMAPSQAATIEDESPALTRQDSAMLPLVGNPLAALGSSDALAGPSRAASPGAESMAASTASVSQAAGGRPSTSPSTAPGRAAPARKPAPDQASPADPDAALLSALLSLGLQPGAGETVNPAATFALRASLPGLSLAERLGECRALGFLRGEQCRLQVCEGQWGIAPECPTAQAGITP